MLIAITGGIGSGKSIVSRMLIAMGYAVYDCDSRARQLIDNSLSIQEEIRRHIEPNCTSSDGRLDRQKVGEAVFSNPAKLALLNKITHSAVRNDLGLWVQNLILSGRPLFVETAILYQSEIDKMVDAVIEVTAPMELRVSRVMRRNNLDRDAVIKRIQSQKYDVAAPHAVIYEIVNDDITAVMPQLDIVLQKISELQ